MLGPPPFPPSFPRGLEDSSHSLHRDLVGLTSSTTSPTYPRYRPPQFRAFRIHPHRAICAPPETLADPSCCRYLRDIVRSLCEHRPSTACLAMTPARGQQPLPSPSTWATPTTQPSFLVPPPTDRTQTTTVPSAFLDGTATDDLSNPSPPTPPISSPLWFATKAYQLPGFYFCFCFFFPR